MTLRQLKIFSVVARHMSLTVAGEELRVSQPSISFQLRLLENELGTKLHRKSGRGIEFTAAGNLLVREAQKIFSRIENLNLALGNRFHESVPASLTVGGSYTASTTCLPFLLARFKTIHVHVKLNLRTEDGSLLIRMVLAGDVDLAIVHNSPTHRQIALEPFGIDQVVACVSRKHPLAKKKVLTFSDMRNCGFVTRRLDDMGRSDRFIDTLRRRGFNPRVVMECDSAEAKRLAVKNQIGIGLLFKAIVDDDLKAGELVELELPGGRLQAPSYIIYHKNNALSATAQDFIELLREYRAKLQSRTEPKRRNRHERELTARPV